MKYKHKIIGAIVLAIIANITFANFALAQGTGSSNKITAQDLKDAQQSPDACKTFRNNVFNVYQGAAKAVWVTTGVGSIDSVPWVLTIRNQNYTEFVKEVGTNFSFCVIVSSSFPDYKDQATTNPAGNSNDGLYARANEYAKDRNEQFKGINIQLANLPAGGSITQAAVSEASKNFQTESQKASAFSAFLGRVLANFAVILNLLLASIMVLAGSIFSAAVNEILTPGVPEIVNIGWQIIRDISNMFFILIMIVMALAAILRLEEYDYRHLMGEVVLMAILVNFSQVIAVTIMDFVNYLAAIFHSDGFGTAIFSTMVTVINPVQDYASIDVGGFGAALLLTLGKTIFLLTGTCIFILLAGMFVIRLVGLYVLIIFSPIAYVLDILPSTKNFAHEWWHKFFHYLLWAPVALFMIRLAIIIAGSTVGNQAIGLGNKEVLLRGGDSAFFYIILCAFLVAAVVVAEHAGMVGSHQIMHAAHKVGHFAGHVAMGAAAQRWNAKTSKWFAPDKDEHGNVIRSGAKFRMKQLGMAVANPVATAKGWMEQSHEDQHREELYAKATARELFKNKMRKDYRRILSQKEEAEGSKEYSDLTVEGMVNAAQKYADGHDHRTALERRRLVRAAAMQARVEDIAEALATDDERDENGFVNMSKFLQRYLQADHDEESVRFIEQDLSTIGEKIDRPELMGLTGDPHVAIDSVIKNQVDNQYGEVGKKEAQLRARMAPQAFGFSMTTIKKTDGTTEYALLYDPTKAKVVKRFDTEEVRDHITRWQDRMKTAIVPGAVDADDGETIIVDSMAQYNSMKNLERVAPQALLSGYATRIGVKNIKTSQYKVTGFKVKLRQADGTLEGLGNIGDGGAGQRFDKKTKELMTPAEDLKAKEDKKTTEGKLRAAAAKAAEAAAIEANTSDED